MSSTYSLTRYYSQPFFDLKSDLKITLPTDKEITAKFNRVYTYSNKSESFVYKIKEDDNAELVLSRADNIITGMYASGNGEKVIFHQTDQNIFAVSVVDEAKFNDSSQKIDFISDNSLINQKVNSNVCLSSTPVCPLTTIDVMVVFTPSARIAWGGVGQSNSFIATAITNFNTLLQNSGVYNVSLNIVYSGEIDYTETGNIYTDLSRFSNNNDSYMDNIHALRSFYGADLCALITSTAPGYCGLGSLNTIPTNYSSGAAFTVSVYSCAISNYSLAHEMGHNMGL